MYSRRFQFSELPKDYSVINSMYIVEHHINDFFRLVCKYYDKDYQKNKSHTTFPDRKYYMTMADGKLGECSRKTYYGFMAGSVFSTVKSVTTIESAGLVFKITEYLKTQDKRVFVDVEFGNIDDYNNFIPPNWFGKDVTEDTEYSDDFIMKAFGNKTFIDGYIENMLMVEELKMGSSKKCKIWK